MNNTIIFYCKKCGNVFSGSQDAYTTCPECNSSLIQTNISREYWRSLNDNEKKKLKEKWNIELNIKKYGKDYYILAYQVWIKNKPYTPSAIGELRRTGGLGLTEAKEMIDNISKNEELYKLYLDSYNNQSVDNKTVTNTESSFSEDVTFLRKYVVLQVTLKEQFIGTGSKNLKELEDVINEQAEKGYRLHTISTASANSTGFAGGDRIQATMVFERIV